MAAKTIYIVGVGVIFAVLGSVGCTSNDGTQATCTTSSFLPCFSCPTGVTGKIVCQNGIQYCDCSGLPATAGQTTTTGAGGSIVTTTTTTTTTVVAGKGGAAGKTTSNKGGAGGAKGGAGGANGGKGGGATTASAGKGGSGTTTTTYTSTKDPKIPEITETCPEFRNGSITFMGVDGINMAAGPKAPGPTAPMLFYWHGTGSFNTEYAMMDGAISNGVTGEGGVIISFTGLSGSGDAMCSGTAIFDTGSFLITDQLYACAVKNHNVDPKRVYIAGCSAGGLFSACMAAGRSSYVAAAVLSSTAITVAGTAAAVVCPHKAGNS
jgi:hypothetical protein